MKNDLILGILIGAAAAIILTRRSTPAPVIIQPTTAQPEQAMLLPSGYTGNMTGYRGNVMIARKPQRPPHYNQLTNPGYPMPGWIAI